MVCVCVCVCVGVCVPFLCQRHRDITVVALDALCGAANMLHTESVSVVVGGTSDAFALHRHCHPCHCCILVATRQFSSLCICCVGWHISQ